MLHFSDFWFIELLLDRTFSTHEAVVIELATTHVERVTIAHACCAGYFDLEAKFYCVTCFIISDFNAVFVRSRGTPPAAGRFGIKYI